MNKAANFVRGQARQNPGTTPPTATRLAEASVQLHGLKQNWLATARDFDALGDGPAAREELLGMGWALRLNELKIACSEASPEIVQRALKIVGILGYKNDSPYALGRPLRDALSGALMISNDRIAAKNASMLLVHKEIA
jgi:acyl-CoA dehydrogenase